MIRNGSRTFWAERFRACVDWENSPRKNKSRLRPSVHVHFQPLPLPPSLLPSRKPLARTSTPQREVSHTHQLVTRSSSTLPFQPPLPLPTAKKRGAASALSASPSTNVSSNGSTKRAHTELESSSAGGKKEAQAQKPTSGVVGTPDKSSGAKKTMTREIASLYSALDNTSTKSGKGRLRSKDTLRDDSIKVKEGAKDERERGRAQQEGNESNGTSREGK